MKKQEFQQRVLAMEARLYRIGYGMLREEQDRKDAVQEAILKAWRGVDKLKNKDLFETWLTRILINECHNIQRTQKRFMPMDAVPERAQSAKDADIPLHDALLALHQDLRLPVILFYMEGYKIREISDILKLPEGTVKSRLKKAKEELKTQLNDREA